MRALALDHQRAYRSSRRYASALLMAAILANAGGVWYVADLDSQARAFEDQYAQMSPTTASAPDAGAMMADIERANSALRLLGVGWEHLFAVLEGASRPEIRLLALEPAPDSRRVRVAGEATAMPALLDYLRRLRAADGVVAADLQSHQLQKAAPQMPVRFVLQIEWRPPS